MAVIVAVGLGILVGLVFPDFAVELKPLGEGFVSLITMMIQPVIFCTIMIGVGSVASAARVGKVGGLALGYFLAMSTVALAIGLVVGNIIKPGEGLEPRRGGGQRRPGGGRGGPRQHDGVPARDHPGLAVLLADQRRGAPDPARRAADRVRPAADGRGGQADPQRHRGAPAPGLPGAGDDHVGGADRCLRCHRRRRRRDRRRRPEEPGRADAGVLPDLRDLRVRRARHGAQAGHRREPVLAAPLPRPRVPADPVDVVLGVGTAAADRQDGARRHRQDDGRASWSRPATRSTSTAPRST